MGGLVDVNCVNNFGRAAVHIASRNGCVPLLMLLKDEGADFEKRGVEDDTAFHLAAWNGHVEVMTFLFHECSVDAHALDAKGQNVAHISARRGEIRALSFAHGIGVDVWLRDKFNMTPLDQTPRGMAKARNFLLSLERETTTEENPITSVSME